MKGPARRFRFSIRSKMLVAFVGLALAPMLLVGAFLSFRAERILRRRMAQELQIEVATAARSLETYLAGVRRDVLTLARFVERHLGPGDGDLPWQRLSAEFLEVARAEPTYYQIRFLDPGGMERVRVNRVGERTEIVSPDRLQDKSRRYYVREALATPPGRVYTSELDLNVERGRVEVPHRLVTRIATVVVGPGGETRGLVVINVFGEDLLAGLKPLGMVREARTILVNGNGDFVEMKPLGAGVRFATREETDLGAVAAPGVLSAGGPGDTALLKGRHGTVAVARVRAGSGREWRVAKILPDAVIERDLRQLHRALGLLALPFSALSALLAVLVASRFSQPIQDLSAVADAIARGAYDRRSRVRSRDELGDLAAAINGMAESLAVSRERLVRLSEDLQRQVDRKVEELRLSEAEAERFRERMQELERQLLQADRLAAMGALSATIAHEIGNPLAGLKMRLQMLQRRTDPESDTAAEIRRMLALVERLAGFLRQLTGYVRAARTGDARPLDLGQALREVAYIVGEDADRRSIAFHVDVPDDPIMVCCPMQHLHQVFMNLILNALQAVGDGGTVSVRAWRENGRAKVEVCDNGPGIPEGLETRIFEPLFTTRPDGTGLGLAIVAKLMEELGGTVRAENRPGGGARFEVCMPEGTARCQPGC